MHLAWPLLLCAAEGLFAPRHQQSYGHESWHTGVRQSAGNGGGACPSKVDVEGVPSAHEVCAGPFSVTATPGQGERPIYKNEAGTFMYYWEEHQAWRIGEDHSNDAAFIISQQGQKTECPSSASGWQHWDGFKWQYDDSIMVTAEAASPGKPCAKCEGPLCDFSTADLMAELNRRKAMKTCQKEQATPEKPAQATPEKPSIVPTITTTTTTKSTPPPPDNFVDELVDQANADFDMLDRDKDGCVSEKEMTVTLKKQVKVARNRRYYWKQKKLAKGTKDIAHNIGEEHSQADVDDDGCLSRREFDTMKIAINNCPEQFRLIDYNADGKVSRQEAATYVSDHMNGADLLYDKFLAVFTAADVNKDHYLSKEEFCEAGPKFDGDGDEKF